MSSSSGDNLSAVGDYRTRHQKRYEERMNSQARAAQEEADAVLAHTLQEEERHTSNSIVGGQGNASERSDEIRAPLRTGYVDRLISDDVHPTGLSASSNREVGPTWYERVTNFFFVLDTASPSPAEESLNPARGPGNSRRYLRWPRVFLILFAIVMLVLLVSTFTRKRMMDVYRKMLDYLAHPITSFPHHHSHMHDAPVHSHEGHHHGHHSDNRWSTGESIGIGMAIATSFGLAGYMGYRIIKPMTLRDSSTQMPDFDPITPPRGSTTPTYALPGETGDPSSEFLSATPTGRVRKNTRARFF